MIGYEAHFKHPFDLIKISTVHLAHHLFSRVHIFKELKPAKLSRRGISIFVGVAISIPILIIFLALFASADLVVSGILEDIGTWLESFTEVGNSIQHIIMIGFFTFCFTLFFAAAFWQRFEIKALQEKVAKGQIESTIVLGAVNLLFIAFLVIQAMYLFGGQAAFDAMTDITYSEYVRQGFSQLTIVAVLVVLLSLTLRWIHSEKANGTITFLHLSLIVQTVLIMISALIRLNLYIDAYDYTPARLFGYWILILLAILFGMMFVNIVRHSSQSNFIRNSLIVIGAAALLFTISTPDATAVKLNIARATVDDLLDPFPMFNQLSAEAVPIMRYVFESGEVPIAGIMSEQPTLEEYCQYHGQFFNYHSPSQQVNVVADFYARQEINNWYRLKSFRNELKWMEWNFPLSKLTNRQAIDTSDENYWQEYVPKWVGDVKIDDISAECPKINTTTPTTPDVTDRME